MPNVTRDFRGLKCPVPSLKMTIALAKKEFNQGDTVEAIADCPTFEDDMKKWCTQWKKLFVKSIKEGGITKVTVQI